MKKILIVMLCVMTLIACSQDDQSTSTGWKAEIDLYLQSEGLSDKQRHILSDYWVTDQEFDEIHDDWEKCMWDEGFTNAEVRDDDRLNPGYVSGENNKLWAKVQAGEVSEDDYIEKLSEVTEECEKNTWRMISMFYIELRKNPDQIDPYPFTLSCLQEAKLLPEDATIETIFSAIDVLYTYETPGVAYCYESAHEWNVEDLEVTLSGE